MQIKIYDHMETTALGICSVPYPVLLGLDWLRQHNPTVDWTCRQLSLSCCGSSTLILAFGKGYSLIILSATQSTLSITSVGMGFGLNNLKIPPMLDNSKNLQSSKSYPAGIFINLQAASSILCPPVLNGLGHVELKAIWATPPLVSCPDKTSTSVDITIIKPEQFHKYTRNSQIGYVWYAELNICINSMTTKAHDPDSPPPKPPPVAANLKDTDQDVKNSVPKKYHDYMDVFSSAKVKCLPEH